MTNIKIPFYKPTLLGAESEFVQRVVQSGPYSGNGPVSKQCEELISESLGGGMALLTPSCTAALELAAILIDVRPGDEVIMPSFTFVSCANAFVLRGAVPVFVDVRPDTMNMDETKIEEAISEKTKAILVVHYGGVGCAPANVRKIADRHKLWLVEDAAQAIGARHDGVPLGSVGHLSTFSFHETKNLHCGEGGALVVNDERLFERAEIVREKGTNRKQFMMGLVDKYTWVDIGSSFLPGEISAAFLQAQLLSIEEVTNRRAALWLAYKENIRNNALEIMQPPIGSGHNGHLFFVKTGSAAIRPQFIKYLASKGIGASFHYIPLHSAPYGLKVSKRGRSCPITDDHASRLVRLPLYTSLSTSELEYVVTQVNAFVL
ncbi:MAG: dTDP-4-amino-4,6-dideoxygalactose transaminase [Betaproteobacteria bacterium]